MRERSVEDRGEALADGRLLDLGGRVVAVEDAAEDLRGVRSLEGQMPHHRLVQEDADPEHVGPRVDRSALDLLGRHVRGAPEHLPRRRDALGVEELGDAEVGELDADAARGVARRGRRRVRVAAESAVLEQDVLRLHVPMHDALGVGVRERREDVECQAPLRPPREAATSSSAAAGACSSNELDDEVLLRIVLRRDVEDLDDVAVLQLGHGLRLDDEAAARPPASCGGAGG